MASEPAAFFGTIALWAVFATILIGVGFHLVREAPEIDRRMDLYLAGRHGAPDESRVSVVALLRPCLLQTTPELGTNEKARRTWGNVRRAFFRGLFPEPFLARLSRKKRAIG
jgi:hypothetical protein